MKKLLIGAMFAALPMISAAGAAPTAVTPKLSTSSVTEAAYCRCGVHRYCRRWDYGTCVSWGSRCRPCGGSYGY
ncbi:MAG TPA: acid shock protein [Hyphomicrobiaceae bacterium]|nr:acid shock protein [Hyphomicrobiaceae bacterium]